MSLLKARQETLLGRYSSALNILAHRQNTPESSEAAHLRLELLERTGQHTTAAAIADDLLSRATDRKTVALCEFVLGRAHYFFGDIQRSITHFQRSADVAASTHDLERLCWAQLNLFVRFADFLGPDAPAALLSELRLNIANSGNPRLAAALHIFVGQVAAQLGQYESATRHNKRAQQLLSTAPEAWLEGVAHANQCAMFFVLAELDTARAHGLQALKLARLSGSVVLERRCLINLSLLAFQYGYFDEALKYSERAGKLVGPYGEEKLADLDNVARIRLAQGRLDECQTILSRGKVGAIEDECSGYVYRQALLTQAYLHVRQGRWDKVLEAACTILRLATKAGDRVLHHTALLMQVDANVQLFRIDDAIELLISATTDLDYTDIRRYSELERSLACWLGLASRQSEGVHHFERAERILRNLKTAPSREELRWRWRTATQSSGDIVVDELHEKQIETHRYGWSLGIQSAAAVLLFSSMPQLMAEELINLLERSGSVRRASAVIVAEEKRTVLCTTGEPILRAETEPGPVRIALGGTPTRRVELEVFPRRDPEAIATLGALVAFIRCGRRLSRMRVFEEAEASLWPLRDDPEDGTSLTVSPGSMAELMNLAQRVAAANLPVLITGESGVGKEVIARFLHKHSPRAAHVFLPFNCSATPRDTLESQLFGHRRGAFTGADRDAPGVIRTAEHGTLFLDEIADLGLDLQPKLLRFLEAGEIFPLGDARPSTVDVRIVAATNADIERAVAEGRFREDLFYRLNVIRLRVPPLRARRDEIPTLARQFAARAAAEAGKTNIRLADETIEQLTLYRWPGNVRQLQNEIRRMVAMTDSDTTLRPQHLAAEIRRELPVPPESTTAAPPPARQAPGKLRPALEKVERDMIQAALDAHLGDLTAAARTLGLSRKGLYLKRQRLGL